MEHTILVIEDNQEMMENIVGILELAHYKVITAMDGRSGVNAAQQCNPDLIICDVMMPELDGFGLLHLLRKDEATCNIPLIFLSAKSERTDVRKGMNLGADDYITKPFDGLELLNAVEMRLKRNQLVNVSFDGGTEGIDRFFLAAKKLREFTKLTDRRVIKKYKKRDLIYLEGQYPAELYFIKSGRVKTFKTNREGKELMLGFHGENEFIGFVPLIENNQSQEGAIAVEDSELYVIPKEDFLTMLYSKRDIAYKFIRLLANNLNRAEERLVELAYHSVRQKVAATLIRIYSQYDVFNRRNLTISISRKDLSNLIGTATESLNRTLLDFKEEGLIELKEDGILIVNYNGIEEQLK